MKAICRGWLLVILLSAGCLSTSHQVHPVTKRAQAPSQIMPPATLPQPSFTIIKITDALHEVPKEDRNPHVVKCYVLEILADGGRWYFVIDQNNRVIFKRFSLF